MILGHSKKYFARFCFDPNKTHHLGWHWALCIYFLAHIRTWRSITWPYTHWYGALTYSYFCKHQVQGRMSSVNNGFIFFLAYIYLYGKIELRAVLCKHIENTDMKMNPLQTHKYYYSIQSSMYIYIFIYIHIHIYKVSLSIHLLWISLVDVFR